MFSKLRNLVSIPLLIAVIALAVAVGSWGLQLWDQDSGRLSSSASETSTLPKEVQAEFNKIFEAWEILRKDHLDADTLEAETLSRGALRGMVEALGDPHAAYLSPEQRAQESADLKGEFQGIGARVAMRNGEITIVTPIPDTPAERAGLRPGDIIIEIDGESAKGLSLTQAVNKIRGPQGEPVELRVFRKSLGEPLKMTIVRAEIKVTSVSLRMLVGRVAHLRITSFTENTDQELEDAINQLQRLGSRGIVLDLRNNPGGLLGTVVNVTSQFIDDGLVLYEVDGNGKRDDWPVRPGGLAKDIPMVVLVNEGSASGSEVLAGALMDNDRAPVIGKSTFGKGSVNTLRRLSDGSGIFFTIARWYTPEGNLIEGDGVEPDIVVDNPEDQLEDLQLDKAIEVLETQVRDIEQQKSGTLQDDNG